MWHAVPAVESDGEEWEDAGGHGHQGREVVDYAVRQAKVPFPTKNKTNEPASDFKKMLDNDTNKNLRNE